MRLTWISNEICEFFSQQKSLYFHARQISSFPRLEKTRQYRWESEVEATALWLPIRRKCPEIYRVIVRELDRSRWPDRKDWLDSPSESSSSIALVSSIPRKNSLTIIPGK